MPVSISLFACTAFAAPFALAHDVTPCCGCDERSDSPRICDDCRKRAVSIEETPVDERAANDVAWLKGVNDVLATAVRAARRAS